MIIVERNRYNNTTLLLMTLTSHQLSPCGCYCLSAVARQAALWAGQSARWQAVLQYHMLFQRLQCRSLATPGSPPCLPHTAQCRCGACWITVEAARAAAAGSEAAAEAPG